MTFERAANLVIAALALAVLIPLLLVLERAYRYTPRLRHAHAGALVAVVADR